MATVIQLINLSNPGEPPVNGDKVRIIYDNGMEEVKDWYEPVPHVPVERTVLSDEEFKARLTLQEKQWLAKKAQEATTPGPQIKAFIDAMNMLGAIDVTDADVVSGFQWLVDNVPSFTAERRDEILASIWE